ncbi:MULTISPECIES: glycerophosphodiester phosphodiesterase [Pseudomonas]|nr:MULTISPECIES: glycerophosphodiester phosphodiesterase [Pseudomonas]KTB71384.1 glycerophosphodiester phosphodiesterase [Pseudomonas sp. ICMP 3272]KTC51927.1 glycerophosphodiester phosphodiesterase [Pseudomonas syringae ICMP 19498]MDU8458693.1 glycerophosphodiester phosphodiesterase [Pseudomonas syringae group sp. J254-4]RMP80542.1 Glycerophosphoryl diester phosphodiesterase [Pseudomonas syringae pv. actinidiae]
MQGFSATLSTTTLLKKTLLAAAVMSGLMLSSGMAAAADAPGKVLSEKYGLPWPAVIAHRGASFDAPEETIPAYTLARDLGADYLEMDIQRTKDGVLIALHDDVLERTTNIAEVFPTRVKDPVSTFTLAELKQLDAGSWFNKAYPDRARASYSGLQILTLDEVIDIAEGGANKPGLYIETKVPNKFPGVEADLKKVLTKRGWLAQRPAAAAGHVNVAHMPGRVVLQTFEKQSLELLQKEMPKVPKVMLLWIGEGSIEPKSSVAFKDSGAKDKASYYAAQEVKSPEEFQKWIDWAKAHGAIGTGPSSQLAKGGDQSYMDLVKPWMNNLTHEKGMVIHPYTVDDAEDFKRISNDGVDGFFTNRTAELLKFYGRPAKESIETILKRNGY